MALCDVTKDPIHRQYQDQCQYVQKHVVKCGDARIVKYVMLLNWMQ